MLFSIGHTADMIARYGANRELRVRKNQYKNIRKQYKICIIQQYKYSGSVPLTKEQLKIKVRRKLRVERIKSIILNIILGTLIILALWFVWMLSGPK